VPKREKLPDDLKEFCALCRAGKLFAVQKWIREGRFCRMPIGNFATSPIRIAIERGFHSLVEVLLQENVVDQEEKNNALIGAVERRNLDLVELLVQYGADPSAIDFETIIWSRHPGIMRWFVAHGLDLESDYAIARAFQAKHREFLGVYMSVRDELPTARRQATMALRYHAADGNLKWVSLLLWAGADPRLPVPKLDDSDVDEEDLETALVAAVRRGQFDVVKKIGIDPTRDDVTALINEYCFWPNSALLEFLIKLGADVRKPAGEDKAMRWAFSSFDSSFRDYSRTAAALRCIEILAANGARWHPNDPYRTSCFRRAIAKAPVYDAIQHLGRIIKAGAIEQPFFQELMRTPRMKEILKQTYPGVIKLREYAGFAPPRFRKHRM
jgi:ankyrin repeat protein